MAARMEGSRENVSDLSGSAWNYDLHCAEYSGDGGGLREAIPNMVLSFA